MKELLAAAALIALPLLFSVLHKPAEESAAAIAASKNVIIVQPNIDPYDEKFDARTVASQMNLLVSLSEQAIDSNTPLGVMARNGFVGSSVAGRTPGSVCL